MKSIRNRVRRIRVGHCEANSCMSLMVSARTWYLVSGTSHWKVRSEECHDLTYFKGVFLVIVLKISWNQRRIDRGRKETG